MKNVRKLSVKKRILPIAIAVALALTVFMPAMSAFAYYGAPKYYNIPPSGPAVDTTYKTTGWAYNDSNYRNTVVLTPAEKNTYGGVWGDSKIDLSKTFRCEAYLYQWQEIGKNLGVGSGIAFCLQNDPRGIYARGQTGAGMNVYAPDFSYMRNSMVIEFDSMYDANSNFASVDPHKDNVNIWHSAFVFPKYSIILPMDHLRTQFYPQSIAWRKLTVEWTPQYFGNTLGGTLSYNYDPFYGMSSYTVSNVNSVFGGTEVYWGFAAATSATTGSLNAVAFREIPAAKGTVNVLHKDQDTGATLKSESFSVNPGYYGPYSDATFQGYGKGTVAPGSDPAYGQIAAGETKNVIFNYKKNVTTQPATVIVIHLTESGTLLKADAYVVNAGYYGPYNNAYFAGYTYAGLDRYSDPINGIIGGGELRFITHRYR